MQDARDWQYEYDGAVPPLPREIERTSPEWIQKLYDLVPAGAYFVWFEPRVAEHETFDFPGVLAGVVRIHHRFEERRRSRNREGSRALQTSGSGDLYQCPRKRILELREKLGSQDDPTTRLELIQRQLLPKDYRYYLRLTSLWVTGQEQVLFSFETYWFDRVARRWEPREPITLGLGGCRAHRNVVANREESQIGTFESIHVAQAVRHAVIRLHAQGGIEPPKDPELWGDALAPADWSVTVLDQIEPMPESQTDRWSAEALRRYHRKHENVKRPPRWALAETVPSEPSPTWEYHLLVVGRIGTAGAEEGPLGLMFDLGSDATGDLSRQAAAIAARERIDETSPEVLQDNPRFLHWAALHELGHMQGLFHNPDSAGLMQPRRYWKAVEPEADQDDWLRHSRDDAHRLRHLPDLWVRPGGVPFAHRYRAMGFDLRDLLSQTCGLGFSAEPGYTTVDKSLEAVTVKLTNHSGRNIVCPYEDEAQPERGFLGALLSTPDGEWRELASLPLPRRLDPSMQTHLAQASSYTFEVLFHPTLDTLRQAGEYRLYVYLTWLVPRSEGEPDLHHARCDTPIYVSTPNPPPPAPPEAPGERS